MTQDPSWQDLLDVVKLLNGSDYEHASVSFNGVSVQLSRTQDLSPQGSAAAPEHTSSTPASSSLREPLPQATATAKPAAEAPVPETSGTAVKAPLMGVFYRSPSPGADPFVKPGDSVTAETTVGIIEVMKMMNPVTAGVAGTVSDYAVEDAAAVEFGQALLHIDEEASA